MRKLLNALLRRAALKTLAKLTEEKLETLLSEYDLTELAANDKLQLTSLAEAMASLDIYNQLLIEALESESIDVRRVKEIQGLITEVTKNVTSISDSLKIDRKSREKKTESIPDYVKDLKVRAKAFLESRMSYIYCPKCNSLVATMWLMRYRLGAKFKFICFNCANSFIITDIDLDKRKNLPDMVVPKGD